MRESWLVFEDFLLMNKKWLETVSPVERKRAYQGNENRILMVPARVVVARLGGANSFAAKLACRAMPKMLQIRISQYPVMKSQAGGSVTMRQTTARNKSGAVIQYSM